MEYLFIAKAQSAGALEYTDCISADLWEMRSTPIFPLFLGLLWPGVEAPNRILSIVQVDLHNYVIMLNWIAWNWTVFTFNCKYITDI